MDFEFQESDIFFTNQDHASTDRSNDEKEHDCYSFGNIVVVPLHDNSWTHGKSKKKKDKKKKMTNSSPVDIPETFNQSPESDYSFEGDDEEEVVPPHVIVGRRVAAKMASSVCFNHGRRLKGRQLKEVRNSILRMTGFLES